MTSDAPLFKTPANPVQSSADVDSATGQSHAPYARALFEGNSGEGVAQPGRRLRREYRSPGSALRRARPTRQPELLLNVDTQIDEAGEHGEIFTRRWVVDLILDLAGYTDDQDLAMLIAVEPACGTGAFLVPMVERLLSSCAQKGRNVATAAGALRAYDLLPANVAVSRQVVERVLRAHEVSATTAAALAATWVTQADYLLMDHDEAADLVCGNPPYIRLENIPPERSNSYRLACPTMGGRADIFVGFYETGLTSLRAGGRLAFICADRWMRNSYGSALRQLVADHYAVDVAVTMHDVDAFEEPVSAYPAITVLRAGEQGRALVANTTKAFGQASAEQLVKWGRSGDGEPLHREGLSAAWLAHWFASGASWPTGSPDRLALVAHLEERFAPIEATGAKVGIGLASGADGVYITRSADAAEPERMLPMVMRADLRSGTVDWSGHYLVNPWCSNGLVDLDDWPKLRRYYESHQPALKARNVAKRNPGREHRTIDRVIEGLRETPKLLLADMSERIWPVLDDGVFYPHHNLYWITSEHSWDLRVLGGLLLSDVAELFVRTYCVRMRGGTLRFQAQYLRRICVPSMSDISEPDRALLVAAFEARDTAAASTVAHRLYDVEAVPT